MTEETTIPGADDGATAAPKKAAPRKPAVKKASAAKATTAKAPGKKAAAPKAAPKPAAAAAEPAPEEKPEEKAEEAAFTMDEPAAEDTGAERDFMAELKQKDWGSYLLRGAFMLMFGFLAWVAISIGFIFAGLQFILLVLAGNPNEQLGKVIMTIGNYIAEVMAYLSLKTDERPFPLGKPLPVDD